MDSKDLNTFVSECVSIMGYTQKELALKLGISPSALSLKLHGEKGKNISKAEAFAILLLLDLPLEIYEMFDGGELSTTALLKAAIKSKKTNTYDCDIEMSNFIKHKWFIYGFSSNTTITDGAFYKYEITVNDNFELHYMLNNVEQGDGKVVIHNKTLIMIIKFQSGQEEICAFEIDLSKILFLASYKSYSFAEHLPIIGFSIASRIALTNEDVESVLLSKDSTQFFLDHNIEKEGEQVKTTKLIKICILEKMKREANK